MVQYICVIFEWESTEMNCQNIWYGNAPISECVGIFFVGFHNTYRIMYGFHPANQWSHKRILCAMIQMKSIIIKWTLFLTRKKKLNKFGKNNEIKRKWLKGHNEKYRNVWQKSGFYFQFNHHVFIWCYQHGIILIMVHIESAYWKNKPHTILKPKSRQSQWLLGWMPKVPTGK